MANPPDAADLTARRNSLDAEALRLEELRRAYDLVLQDLASQGARPGNVRLTTSGEEVNGRAVDVGHSGTDTKSQTVRDAVAAVGDKFTLLDVVEKLFHGRPTTAKDRQHVSFTLSRFKNKGEILLHRQGKGNRPSVYRKPPVQQDLPV